MVDKRPLSSEEPPLGGIREAENAETGCRLDDGGYTLVIPTYKRPELLARLLRYLEQSRLEAPVLILDSSPEPELGKNLSAIEASGLSIRHERYDSEMHPYAKIRDGLEKVDTPILSIIADDDVVIVPTLRNLVQFLRENEDHSACHGIYVNFREYDEYFQFSYVEQKESGITNKTALERLNVAMANYNVMFYAVQRTEAARRAFAPILKFKTTLGGELSSGLLLVAQGKIGRLDELYIGRSTDDSHSYSGWHPHQLICDRPALLFEDYAIFRETLSNAIIELEPDPRDDVADIVDLIALRYLAPFLKTELVNFIVNQKLFGKASGSETYDALWNRFVRPQRPEIERVELYLDEERTFNPGVQRQNDPPRDYAHSRKTALGERLYLFHNEFYFPDVAKKLCIVSRRETEFLMDHFDLYLA